MNEFDAFSSFSGRNQLHVSKPKANFPRNLDEKFGKI